jgi:hypothetical protein
MKDVFLKTMVALAAIATTVGGGAAVVNGFRSLIDTRVESVLLVKEQQQNPLLDIVEDVGALVKGHKK